MFLFIIWAKYRHKTDLSSIKYNTFGLVLYFMDERPVTAILCLPNVFIIFRNFIDTYVIWLECVKLHSFFDFWIFLTEACPYTWKTTRVQANWSEDKQNFQPISLYIKRWYSTNLVDMLIFLLADIFIFDIFFPHFLGKIVL